MKKEFALGFIISIILHGLLVCEFSSSDTKANNTFSKNEGLEQTRVSVRSIKTIQRKQLQKAKGLQKEKKKLVKQKVDQQAGSAKNSSGNNKVLSKYLSLIRSKILQNKYKSKIARKLNQTGRVTITFKIINRNKVSDISILTPSRSKQLNYSALKTIQRLESLPNIPKELNLDILSVEVSIDY